MPPRGHGHSGKRFQPNNARPIHHVLEPRSRHGRNATGYTGGVGRGNADKAAAAPKAKASPEALHEANTFEVPVRGRDVPHPQRGRSQSTAPQRAPQRASSSCGYYDADQGVIWHQDRSGRYWSSTARDDRQDAQQSNWHSNWWDDRDWWSWSSTQHGNWHSDQDAWHNTARDSPRHRPAPQPEQVHGNVLHDGWQASLLVDRPVLHNRGRPYYVGARGQYLCGIACTASHCNYNRMPCNYTIRDLASDWHTGHECSFCRRDREQRRNAQRRDDP